MPTTNIDTTHQVQSYNAWITRLIDRASPRYLQRYLWSGRRMCSNTPSASRVPNHTSRIHRRNIRHLLLIYPRSPRSGNTSRSWSWTLSLVHSQIYHHSPWRQHSLTFKEQVLGSLCSCRLAMCMVDWTCMRCVHQTCGHWIWLHKSLAIWKLFQALSQLQAQFWEGSCDSATLGLWSRKEVLKQERRDTRDCSQGALLLEKWTDARRRFETFEYNYEAFAWQTHKVDTGFHEILRCW